MGTASDNQESCPESLEVSALSLWRSHFLTVNCTAQYNITYVATTLCDCFLGCVTRWTV